QQIRDLRMLVQRNRTGIEEAARVVELHAWRSRKFSQRPTDLTRDGAWRHRLLRRVLPEIAHQPSPRTLPVRQEERRDIDDLSALRPLRLNKGRNDTRDINLIAGSTSFQNPTVAV